MIELRLTRAIIGMTSGLFALATEGDDELTEEALTSKLARADRVQLAVSFAGRRPVPSGFQQSVPGYMVMFTLMNLLMYGGISIAGERTSGVLRRIAVHPITPISSYHRQDHGPLSAGHRADLRFLPGGRRTISSRFRWQYRTGRRDAGRFRLALCRPGRLHWCGD